MGSPLYSLPHALKRRSGWRGGSAGFRSEAATASFQGMSARGQENTHGQKKTSVPQYIVEVQELPGGGRKSIFFGSRFGDRFWRSLGEVLEANMGPNTVQNGVRKGSEKKTNFEDDFGRRRGGPEPSRTLQPTPGGRRKADQAHPGFLLSAKLWNLRALKHALPHCVPQWAANPVPSASPATVPLRKIQISRPQDCR